MYEVPSKKYGRNTIEIDSASLREIGGNTRRGGQARYLPAVGRRNTGFKIMSNSERRVHNVEVE